MAEPIKNVCAVCGRPRPEGAPACPHDGNTLFVERAARSLWPGVAVVGVVVVTAGLGGFAWLHREPLPSLLEAVPPTPTPTAARVEPVVGVPVLPIAPVVSPAVEPATEPGIIEAPVGGGRAPLLKHPARDTSPSTSELARRVQFLEENLRARTSSGPADPSALQLLDKQRLRLTMSLSSVERRDVSKRLDNWERTFLRR